MFVSQRLKSDWSQSLMFVVDLNTLQCFDLRVSLRLLHTQTPSEAADVTQRADAEQRPRRQGHAVLSGASRRRRGSRRTRHGLFLFASDAASEEG